MGFIWTYSLFSYSVPEVPWPRSPVSLMTVGEQSIICTPPNIAQHPLGAGDWSLRVREKTCFPQKGLKITLVGVLIDPHEDLVSKFAALNLPWWSRVLSFYILLRWAWTILEVDHMKDLVGWFVLFLRQLVSERKKVFVVSWVIIRDEKARTNSRGRNYLPSSGYATGAVVSLILSRLHI